MGNDRLGAKAWAALNGALVLAKVRGAMGDPVAKTQVAEIVAAESDLSELMRSHQECVDAIAEVIACIEDEPSNVASTLPVLRAALGRTQP